MSAIGDIVTAVASAHEGSAALKYNKAVHATGEGDRYEERLLALVFLRCLRRGLLFQLSANNGDAGKFDDVVLVWRTKERPEVRILCVQLKHKKSSAIHSAVLLSPAKNSDFGLSTYCNSYEEISNRQEMHRATCVLLTNACLGESSLKMLVERDVGSVPGLELLQAGGDPYSLNKDNRQVWEAVHENTSFVENFYLLCRQRNSEGIVKDICGELEELLGAGDLCESICDSLCKNIREWMNKSKVCLTRDWSKWQALVDEYVRKEITRYKVVTTRLKYCNVVDIQRYVQSCNPARVRPPQRGTEALSATKIHEALAHQTHIMVTVEQFTQLQQKILRCWGPYCQWLVIVDADREDNSDILNELESQIQTERRLVIVSWKGQNCFVDTCQSSDVSDDSWIECLDIGVRLNGDRYECRMGDLVAGIDAIKSLLNDEPALLLALAQLSQPLRLGRELEPLPAYYIHRKLVDAWLVKDEFFSGLGWWDVCVTDSASFEPLSREIGRGTVVSLEEIRSCFPTSFQIEWPLYVLTDNMETIREEYKCWGSFNIYILKRSDKGWKILNISGEADKTRGCKIEQEKEQLEALDSASNVVIVEGRPGVGKSKMLSHVAEQIKERDSGCWLLRVNLLEFCRVLDHSGSPANAVEEILKATVFNEDELGRLEYALLRYSLLQSPRVICLVDGFDEVCPDYADKCIEVLHLLSPRKGKLLVTTRPALVRLLEARMGVMAHSLRPFSKLELEDFFRKHPSSENIPPLSGLNQNLRNLLRIPLFAEMFAKLSQEKADTYDIVTLYEAFFQNNFRRLYEEKLGENFSTPGKKREVEEAQKRHEEQLMLLAESILFPSTFELPMLSSDMDYFMKSGIVYMFANGKPTFLHRTFAEHFLAKKCFLTDRKQYCARLYRKGYTKKRLDFFLESFDRRVARGRPLLEALLDGNKGEVEASLAGGADARQTDACGRNALHLAAAYSTRHSLSLSLLQLLCNHAGVGALSTKDSLLGWTPVRYAAEGRCWATVRALLEEGGDLGQLGNFRARLCDPTELQDLFEDRGYWALYQRVLRLNRASRKVEAAWHAVDTQTQFAVCLISTNLSRESLGVIAERAWKKGHQTRCCACRFHFPGSNCQPGVLFGGFEKIEGEYPQEKGRSLMYRRLVLPS